jgi:hypothetical protein
MLLDEPGRMREMVKGHQRLYLILPEKIDDLLAMFDRFDIPLPFLGLNSAPFERESISIHSQIPEQLQIIPVKVIMVRDRWSGLNLRVPGSPIRMGRALKLKG